MLPKNGRTHSLLAAAHKAQAATFVAAAPMPSGQQPDEDRVDQVCCASAPLHTAFVVEFQR